jgi:hypothetical protein
MRRRKNGAGTLDLTNFSGRKTWRIVNEKILEISGGPDVSLFQVGINGMGLEPNRLAQSLFSTEGTAGGWSIEQVRIKSITVNFDARGVTPNSTAFNTRPRLGAFLTPDGLAEIDPDRLKLQIGDFTPHTITPNGSKSIRLPMGPEFSLGRFGGGRTAMTLVILTNGFQGSYRIITELESTGFPGARVILDQALESAASVGMDAVLELPTQDQESDLDQPSDSE